MDDEPASVLGIHLHAVLSAEIPPHVMVNPVWEATRSLRPTVDVCNQIRKLAVMLLTAEMKGLGTYFDFR